MILAISSMSAEATAICYLVALVVFIIAAVLCFLGRSIPLGLIATGLSFWVLVNFWNALAAA